tara:strand:+ start:41 stop:259 length:219 start_codon:yes stop_codon:yes gene_type:complete
MTDKDIFEMQARLVETYQEMDKLAHYFKRRKAPSDPLVMVGILERLSNKIKNAFAKTEKIWKLKEGKRKEII